MNFDIAAIDKENNSNRSMSKSVNFSDDNNRSQPVPTPRSNQQLNRSIDFYETYHAYVNDMKYLGDQLKGGKFDRKLDSETEKSFKKRFEAKRKLFSPSPLRLGPNPDPRALSTMDWQLLQLSKKEAELKGKQPIIVGRYKDMGYSRDATSKSRGGSGGSATTNQRQTLSNYMPPKKPLVDMKQLKEMHEQLVLKATARSAPTRKK